ncbi:DUF1566 domain-containing protein [Candidatus Parcubacteria bacterium]|nr:DUF1566 domain-containing protein [Candidatus Parcubacteria bacterium]
MVVYIPLLAKEGLGEVNKGIISQKAFSLFGGIRSLEIFKVREYFADGNYWSSTENSATNAWKQNFTTGNQNNNNKTNSNYVRCVRG